jgi:hypothetical protein
MAQVEIPIAAGAEDSDVGRFSGTSMSAAFSATNQWFPTNAAVRCAYQFNSPNYQYFVALMSFDTSLIGAGATVTGATLRFYARSETSWVTADVTNCALQVQGD